MRRATSSVWLAGLAACCLGVECGPIPPYGSDGGPLPNACTPGAVVACPCAGGGQGTQTCFSSGSGYGLCLDCSAADAGTGVPPVDAGSPAADPLVTVAVRSAVLGIAQINGEEWDPSSRVAGPLLTTLGGILGSTPHPYAQIAGQLLNFLGGQDFSHYDKPDPFGTASIFAVGRWQIEQPLSTQDNNTENTFAPTWRGADGGNNVGWVHVRLTNDVRLRLVVWDEDTFKDDPVGDVEISNADLRAALASGSIYFARTAEASNRQLLFVGISVAAE